MASLWSVGSETHAVGFWWIDEKTFDALPRLYGGAAWNAILAGKCIFTFADVRSCGVEVRIFDADWKRLTAWEVLPTQVSEYGDFVLNYPRGEQWNCGRKSPLAMPDGELGRNVSFPV